MKAPALTPAVTLCLLLACAAPGAAANPEVTAKRAEVAGEAVFEVVASVTVRASPASVWKVLTDYERMPEFVPDLEMTRVLSRSGNRAVLEQGGRVRFMFLSRAVNLTVQVQEDPMSSIAITLVSGDMKTYDCHWQLVPLPDGGTRVDYSGRMVPRFYVPAILGSGLMRRDVTRMMQAVQHRLDQHQAG